MMFLHSLTKRSQQNQMKKRRCSFFALLVENRGFEPLTPALPAQCSTAELIPHNFLINVCSIELQSESNQTNASIQEADRNRKFYTVFLIGNILH